MCRAQPCLNLKGQGLGGHKWKKYGCFWLSGLQLPRTRKAFQNSLAQNNVSIIRICSVCNRQVLDLQVKVTFKGYSRKIWSISLVCALTSSSMEGFEMTWHNVLNHEISATCNTLNHNIKVTKVKIVFFCIVVHNFQKHEGIRSNLVQMFKLYFLTFTKPFQAYGWIGSRGI